jgi:hypothetical protein
VSSLASSLESIHEIHSANKWRSEWIAGRRITELRHRGASILYFPVSLAQLSASEAHRIAVPPKLLQQIEAIPTDLIISDDDARALQVAAWTLLTTPQSPASFDPSSEWRVGQPDGAAALKPVNCLGMAIATAIVRTNLNDWEHELQFQDGADASDWFNCTGFSAP